MKLKDTCSLERKPTTNLNSILKSRDISVLAKVHIVKAMVFPVVMYGYESWSIKKAVLKNWCIGTVVLEKTLESPLDCKQIKPVNPKGNESWIFIGRTHAEAETNTLATWCEELTHWKRSWCWEKLKEGGEGDNRGWDDWMASLTRWTWIWASSWVGDEQESLACCNPWGHKESDTTEWLNWTDSYVEQFFMCLLTICMSSFA